MSTEFLQGGWVIKDSPTPLDAGLDWSDDQAIRKTLYETYGVEIEPVYYSEGKFTIYGITPYLNFITSGGSIVPYYLTKIKNDGSEDYYYAMYSTCAIQNQVTVLPSNYHSLSVQWVKNNATPASVIVKYNNLTLVNLAGNQKTTLNTAEKELESNIVVESEQILQTKEIAVSGDCEVEADPGYQGLSKVVIAAQFPDGQKLQIDKEVTLTESGVVSPDAGFDGMTQVKINIAIPVYNRVVEVS